MYDIPIVHYYILKDKDDILVYLSRFDIFTITSYFILSFFAPHFSITALVISALSMEIKVSLWFFKKINKYSPSSVCCYVIYEGIISGFALSFICFSLLGFYIDPSGYGSFFVGLDTDNPYFTRITLLVSCVQVFEYVMLTASFYGYYKHLKKSTPISFERELQIIREKLRNEFASSRSEEEEDEDAPTQVSVQQNSAPQKYITITIDHVILEVICSTCLEEFKLFESVRELPCSHIFHKACINSWLKEQKSCPLCRRNPEIIF